MHSSHHRKLVKMKKLSVIMTRVDVTCPSSCFCCCHSCQLHDISQVGRCIQVKIYLASHSQPSAAAHRSSSHNQCLASVSGHTHHVTAYRALPPCIPCLPCWCWRCAALMDLCTMSQIYITANAYCNILLKYVFL